VRINGSTVLVTGASSGIGAALAVQLAARGATLGLVARRHDRLRTVLERCRVHAPASQLWVADLQDVERAGEVALLADEELGGVDCLVNVHAPVRMTLALLPRWRARGTGAVVNVASLGGRIGIASEAAYCASKFALCGWSESMAIDLYGTDVEVKLVLTGPVDTEIWDQPGNDRAAYNGPLVPVEECAGAVADALEHTGFEFYAPRELPGGMGSQHDVVVGKTADPGAFVELMGSLRPPPES
jgi:short-subunit dehydrogenase